MSYRFRNTAIAALFLVSSNSMAGIPVFDTVQNIESINQFTQEVQQWANTVTHYKNQLAAYKQQLATATGIRDIQSFMSDAKKLRNDMENLRKNGVSMDSLLTNSGGSYTAELDRLYDKYKSLSGQNCEGISKKSYQSNCKQIVLNQAIALENTSDVQDKISNALSDIANLSGRMESSQDTKESQDLANAISAKSVQLNALSTQWEMSVKQAEQRNQMLVQQKQKAFYNGAKNDPVLTFSGLN